MEKIKKQFNFHASIKSIFVVLFVVGSFVVFANSVSAVNWKPNPDQCPVTYNGQIGNPGEVMCGLLSGVAQWYDMTTLVGLVPAVSTTVNTGGGTYGGYVVDCDAFDSTVPRCDNTGSFWCSPDATCNSAYRKTECASNKWATESGSFACDDCQTGRWDCDSNNTCEIASGASCTANLGGNSVPGTYNCTAGGTCSDLGGNTATCTCVPGIQYFQTGIQAQFATTSPLLWGTQYGSGDLVRISNNDLSTTTFMVSNSGQVGIGLTSVTNQYVALDVSSTERGVLLPRLTTVQRNAILTPPESLLVYNIDNHQFEYYATSSWLAIIDSGSFVESDPIWSAVSTSLTVSNFATSTVSQWNNDAGYLTSYTTTSPAGSDSQIQFNDSGAFGATTSFVWDNSFGRLGISTATPAGKVHVITGAGAEVTIGTPSNVYVSSSYASSKKYYTANGYAHNLQVYAYKDTSAGRVYSSSYDDLASNWTDDNSANTYDLSWTWDAVSGASGYRILKYDTFHPYGYDVYKDVATNSYTDDNNDGWLSLPSMTPTLLYESGKAMRLGYDSSNYVDFNINDDASFGMFNDAGTGILYMDADGKIGVGSTGPLSQLYVGGTGDIIAEGIFNNGDSLGVSGAGTRMIWYPEKAAFRAGRVTGDDWDDANVGDYSAAFGYDNQASGEYSFIAGQSNSDTGAGNAIFGIMNSVSNTYYSIVAGLGNTVSSSFGSFAEYNAVFGSNNFLYNTAKYTLVAGGGNTVTSTYSSAIGQSNVVKGDFSYVFGNDITANANYSFGVNVSSTGVTMNNPNTIALMGGNVGIGTTSPLFKLTVDGGIYASGTFNAGETLTYAGAGTRLIWYPKKAAFRAGRVAGVRWDDAEIGIYSVAFGYDTYATGSYSNAFGRFTTAGADYATAFGWLSKATGQVSAVFGYNNTASGQLSFAIGEGNNASGIKSFAFGHYNTSGGTNSLAGGTNSVTGGSNTIAFGYHAVADGYLGAGAFGYYSTSSGDTSFAFGRRMIVTGDYSFGINVANNTPYTLSQPSTIALMGGNVGIGTTTPSSRLTVVGGANFTNGDFQFNGNAGSAGEILMSGGSFVTPSWAPTSSLGLMSGTGLVGHVSYWDSASSQTYDSDGNFYWDETNNRLGIGTTYPSTTLHISGTTTAQNIVPYMVGTPNNVSLYNLGASTSRWNELWAGTVNIGASTWSLKATGADRFGIFSGPNGTATETISILQNSGYVGIGTVSPSEALQVNGNIRIPNTSATVGSILMSSARYIHSYGDLSNFFAGNSAGNYTLTPASAKYNTGVGNSALSNLSTGSYNSAFGYRALYNNQSGRDNVAIGSYALYTDISGGANVAVGYYALYTNNSGHANVAIGYNALLNQVSASSTAIGYRALQGQDGFSGEKNVAIGYESMQEISSASSNTAVGYQSLSRISIGNSNVAIGTNALDYLSTGSQNVAIGHRALGSITFETGNVAVGYNAASRSAGGYDNTTIGPNSGIDITSGDANTFIGSGAGNTSDSSNIIGQSNTAIGNLAQLSKGTLTGATAIGYMAIASTSNDIYLGSNGADVYYWKERANAYYICVGSTGVLYSGTSCANSDEVLKTDITDISSSIDVLDALKQLRGVYHYWDISKPGYEGATTSRQVGMIAQEVQAVLPELVALSGDEDHPYLTLDYSRYTAFLTEVAKAQQNILDPITDAIHINTTTHDLTFGVPTTSYNLTTYGDLSFILPSDSTSTHKISFTNTAEFTSSVSSTPDSRAFIFNALNFNTSTSDNYILSLRSNDNPVFSVSSNGDVHSSGNMYASSAVLGTSTNPGDLAEKVDINPMETVEAGDVMMVDPASPDRYQKSNSAYEPTIAGVISTNPTIIVGNGKTDQTAPLAMVGRVPVKYSEENGPIERGDLLVSASTPGYAMKYDPIKDNSRKVVGIIGIALDNSIESVSGKVMALIRTGWVYNKTQAVMNLEQQVYYVASSAGVDLSVDPEVVNVETTNEGSITYNSDSNLSLNNFSITNVKSIISTNNKWTIDENGVLITKIITAEGTEKNIYGMTSESAEITLSGSAQLVNGEAVISFATDTQWLIDENQEIKVIPALTSGECNGIFVSTKSAGGFTVKELNGGTSASTFDWLVIAKRKIVETISTPSVDPPTTTLPIEPSTTTTPPTESPTSTPSTSTPSTDTDPPTTTPLTEISPVEDSVSTSSPD